VGKSRQADAKSRQAGGGRQWTHRAAWMIWWKTTYTPLHRPPNTRRIYIMIIIHHIHSMIKWGSNRLLIVWVERFGLSQPRYILLFLTGAMSLSLWAWMNNEPASDAFWAWTLLVKNSSSSFEGKIQ
jgi:hypothetical protein